MHKRKHGIQTAAKLHFRWHRRPHTRTRASVTEAPAQEPHNTEVVETDLHKKCLQAAIDLQEHGWAVVEDVLTQYVTHKASLLANASFVC